MRCLGIVVIHRVADDHMRLIAESQMISGLAIWTGQTGRTAIYSGTPMVISDHITLHLVIFQSIKHDLKRERYQYCRCDIDISNLL
jgi:hypothetical protein